ncbi:MAG: hypothetical protein ACOX2F_05680 [bacterium]
MIHSINILQNAVGLFEHLSPVERDVAEVIPFLGLAIVLSGLTVIAITLTQLKRFDNLSGFNPLNFLKRSKKEEVPKTEVPDVKPVEKTSSDEDDIEQYVAAIGLSLYLTESSEKIALTEVRQFHDQTPWTSTSMFRQSNRFKKWQSIKK